MRKYRKLTELNNDEMQMLMFTNIGINQMINIDIMNDINNYAKQIAQCWNLEIACNFGANLRSNYFKFMGMSADKFTEGLDKCQKEYGLFDNLEVYPSDCEEIIANKINQDLLKMISNVETRAEYMQDIVEKYDKANYIVDNEMRLVAEGE